ncbi:uncharacterized protein LOC127844848 isoform X2 [Dreissena polymorpha]|nr:uncharacterized protein LOC127844848 isoform X2 [Dreissena polymorpha]
MEMGRILKEAQETLEMSKQVAVNSGKQISQQLLKALMEIQSKMSYCQKEIDEHTQRGIDKITSAEKSAITRIGQVMLDSDSQATDRNIKEFFYRLIHHYEKALSDVPISPLVPSINRNIRELYSFPAVRQISRHNSAKTKVDCYAGIFYKDEKLNGRIFIQGEPGVGKSTFATNLTLDWLGQKSSSQHLKSTVRFVDVQTLNVFDFVFFVTLRDSMDQRDIVRMIKAQLIDTIYTDEYRGVIYKLLQYIMRKYRCLVVLDGLDEWSDPYGQLAIPLMASSNFLCTLLITTRPWKMTDERIIDSHIDILLEIEGVDNPDLLCERIIGCLFNNNKDIKQSEFNSYIVNHQLVDLLSSPTMLTLNLCLWADGLYLKGSRCEIYSHILDCLLKKMSKMPAFFGYPPFKCFRKTLYCFANVALIEALSRVAFALLFSYKQEISLVFGNNELMKYLSKEQKECALISGILSQRKHMSIAMIKSIYSFVHKSMQEFLAAYYIANNPQVIQDVIVGHIFKFGNLHIDISQIFRFLCGLNIKVAEKLSFVMNTTCSSLSHLGRTTQNIILAGYKEAISNNYSATDIRLFLFYFNFYYIDHTYSNYTETDAKDLARILLANKSNVKFLSLNSSVTEIRKYELQDIITLSAHCLECLELDGDYGVLDLSACYNLEVIILRGHVSFPTDSLYTLRKLKRLALLNEGQSLPDDTLRLPPSIEQLHVRDGVYSLPMLRHLLNSDHHIYCNIDIFDDHRYENVDNQTGMFNGPFLDRHKVGMSYMCETSGIGLKCFGFGHGVHEALRGSPIRRLSMTGIPNARLLSFILPTLNCLEELIISTMELCCDLKLPPAIRLIKFDPIICSSSSLRAFAIMLSKFNHPIKCDMRVCKMIENKTPELIICPEWFSCSPEKFLMQIKDEGTKKYKIVDYFGMTEVLVSVITDCLPAGLTLGKPKKGSSVVRRYMTEFIKQSLNMIDNSKERFVSNYPVLCKLSICHENIFQENETENAKIIVPKLEVPSNISSLSIWCKSNDTVEIFEALFGLRSIKSATIVGVDNIALLSEAFPTFINLEKIRIITCPWMITPNALRRVLRNISNFNQTVQLRMLFAFEAHSELFLEIKLELSMMRKFDIIRFVTLRGCFVGNYYNAEDIEDDDYKLITPAVDGMGNQFISLDIRYNYDEVAETQL